MSQFLPFDPISLISPFRLLSLMPFSCLITPFLQMIPESLRQRLFSGDTQTPDRSTTAQCTEDLARFGLNQHPAEPGRMVDVELPERMRNLPEFFEEVAREQLTPYRAFIDQVCARRQLDTEKHFRSPGFPKKTLLFSW